LGLQSLQLFPLLKVLSSVRNREELGHSAVHLRFGGKTYTLSSSPGNSLVKLLETPPLTAKMQMAGFKFIPCFFFILREINADLPLDFLESKIS
jgi:hypothetical protein